MQKTDWWSASCGRSDFALNQRKTLLTELVVNTWKDINEEYLKKPMPKHIPEVAINCAQVMDVLYKEENSLTQVKKPQINAVTSMLIDPVPEN